MYRYSPIKKIYIKNFRNIGEAVIDFEDSPIVSLIGENEAGKTSVVKAFSVCALHSTPRDQKDFIRDGTQGFGVAIELQDGTMVTRMKTSTLNRYNVKKPDGTETEISKIDSGLPAVVQEVMGLIEEPETKEYLQVRTYEDQLLFVVTPASTNYKVMYDALKVDQLTRAIKVGSKEANQLKAEIDNGETGISTLTASLRGIRTFDIEPLLNIKSRLAKELNEVAQLENVAKLVKKINTQKQQLGAISELMKSNIQEVDESEAYRVNSIATLLNNITRLNESAIGLKEAEELEFIDTTDVDKLTDIINRISTIELRRKQAGALVDIGDAEEIDLATLVSLINTTNLVNTLSMKKEMESRLDVSDASLIEQSDFDIVMKAQSIMARKTRNNQLITANKQIEDYCSQVEGYLKSIGAAVETCPKCGETIVIDIDKFTQAGV